MTGRTTARALRRGGKADRVYAAEFGLEPGRAFTTLREVQKYLDALAASPWWSERFPHVVRVEAVGIRSDAVDGVGRPEFHRLAGVVGISRNGRNELTVLHETTHAVCDPDAGHGPRWARTYLEMVYRVMGEVQWSALRAAFVEHGVALDPASTR